MLLEGWQSGRLRQSWKLLYRKVPWVRILPPPFLIKILFMTKSKIFILTIFSIIFLSLFCLSLTFAEYQLTKEQRESMRPQPVEVKSLVESDTTKVVSTPDNVIFKIAKDRPIVKINGESKPIEIDSYIYLKFEKLENQFKSEMERITKYKSSIVGCHWIKRQISWPASKRACLGVWG